MKFEAHREAKSRNYLVQGVISPLEQEEVAREILSRAIDAAASAIAERFLADHLQDVLAMLNPEAIANLAVADAAGAIRETLHKKLPDKILEVVRTEREVYQRGVFGGMRRIR